MAVKYFCDVCKKEVTSGNSIHLMNYRVKIRIICLTCWEKVEKLLLKLNP